MRVRRALLCLVLLAAWRGTARAGDDLDLAELDALPDDDARAAVAALRDAADTHDGKALLALIGPKGLTWLGTSLSRKVVAARLKKQDVTTFLGVSASGSWRVSCDAATEIHVAHARDGGHELVLTKRKKKWTLSAIRAASLDTTAHPPFAVVLLIDHSRLMTDDLLKRTKTALRATVDALDGGDQVTIILVGEQPSVIVEALPVADRERITRTIDAIQSGSGPSQLTLAFVETATLLSKGTATDKVVIALTNKNMAPKAMLEAVAALHQSGATVTLVGFGSYDEATLDYLARTGGGRVYLTDEQTSLAPIFIKEIDAVRAEH